MTFGSGNSPMEPLSNEGAIWVAKGDEDYKYNGTKTPLARQKESKDDFCKDTEIANWEDEGGAYFDRPDALLRDRGLKSESVLAVHMDTAESLMMSGDYDGAFSELQAAAELFIFYRDRIDSSFNKSIAQLSTLGCRATPPHPKALPLVKLHQQITP